MPRFQSLCERFGLKLTYLANYEMANDKRFQKFGRDVLDRGAGEIGMHPHAWNMPPGYDLTGGAHVHQPYLFDYPGETRCQKIEIMPRCLERIFETKMVSHRAGRWGFDNYYARILAEFDYKVDCSITPHMSWRLHTGDPTGPAARISGIIRVKLIFWILMMSDNRLLPPA